MHKKRFVKTGNFLGVNLYVAVFGSKPWKTEYTLKRLQIFALITMVLCFNVQEMFFSDSLLEMAMEYFLKFLCSLRSQVEAAQGRTYRKSQCASLEFMSYTLDLIMFFFPLF